VRCGISFALVFTKVQVGLISGVKSTVFPAFFDVRNLLLHILQQEMSFSHLHKKRLSPT